MVSFNIIFIIYSRKWLQVCAGGVLKKLVYLEIIVLWSLYTGMWAQCRYLPWKRNDITCLHSDNKAGCVDPIFGNKCYQSRREIKICSYQSRRSYVEGGLGSLDSDKDSCDCFGVLGILLVLCYADKNMVMQIRWCVFKNEIVLQVTILNGLLWWNFWNKTSLILLLKCNLVKYSEFVYCSISCRSLGIPEFSPLPPSSSVTIFAQ